METLVAVAFVYLLTDVAFFYEGEEGIDLAYFVTEASVVGNVFEGAIDELDHSFEGFFEEILVLNELAFQS